MNTYEKISKFEFGKDCKDESLSDALKLMEENEKAEVIDDFLSIMGELNAKSSDDALRLVKAMRIAIDSGIEEIDTYLEGEGGDLERVKRILMDWAHIED